MEQLEQVRTDWPQLAWRDWQKTAETLHMWTQIVGKTRLALSPHAGALVERSACTSPRAG